MFRRHTSPRPAPARDGACPRAQSPSPHLPHCSPPAPGSQLTREPPPRQASFEFELDGTAPEAAALLRRYPRASADGGLFRCGGLADLRSSGAHPPAARVYRDDRASAGGRVRKVLPGECGTGCGRNPTRKAVAGTGRRRSPCARWLLRVPKRRLLWPRPVGLPVRGRRRGLLVGRVGLRLRRELPGAARGRASPFRPRRDRRDPRGQVVRAGLCPRVRLPTVSYFIYTRTGFS